MTRNQLEQQIQACLDDTLTESEKQHLFNHLKQHPDDMRLYCLTAAMDCGLSRLAKGELSLNSSSANFSELAQQSQKRKMVRISLLTAAAVLAISLVAMRLFFIDHSAPPSLTFKTSTGTQFTITHDGSSDPPPGRIMEKGSRLQLSQGTVELTFASGVKSIIMAPADMTLHDDDQLYLGKGTAWFQVPKGAEGFQVNTSDLNIVDLGTEFGVLAKPNDHDQVHVLKGKVQVTTLRVRKESATLTADQARQIDPIGRLTTIPVKASSFLTHLPSSIPYLHWSFDQPNPMQVSGPHPLAANISTSAQGKPQFTKGQHGMALSLGNSHFYLQTDWKGFLGQRPRSVSLWLRVDGPKMKEKEIASLLHWGDEQSNRNNKWKIGLLKAAIPDATVIRLSFGDDWFNTNTEVADGQWHHCLVIYRGVSTPSQPSLFDVYIDGQRQELHHFSSSLNTATAAISPNIFTKEKSLLSIGGDASLSTTTSFPGDIDDVTIFDGVLPESQIPALMNGSLIRQP